MSNQKLLLQMGGPEETLSEQAAGCAATLLSGIAQLCTGRVLPFMSHLAIYSTPQHYLLHAKYNDPHVKAYILILIL